MTTDPPPSGDLPEPPSDQPLPSYPMDEEGLDVRFENPGMPRRQSLNPQEVSARARSTPTFHADVMIERAIALGSLSHLGPGAVSPASEATTSPPLSAPEPGSTTLSIPPSSSPAMLPERGAEMAKPAPPPDLLPADPLPPPPPPAKAEGVDAFLYEAPPLVAPVRVKARGNPWPVALGGLALIVAIAIALAALR